MRNLPARQTYNKICWHSFIGISFIWLVLVTQNAKEKCIFNALVLFSSSILSGAWPGVKYWGIN